MELVNYLNKLVHITLNNDFYYKGKVVSADSNSITILDKNNKLVTLSISSVATIRELE